MSRPASAGQTTIWRRPSTTETMLGWGSESAQPFLPMADAAADPNRAANEEARQVIVASGLIDLNDQAFSSETVLSESVISEEIPLDPPAEQRSSESEIAQHSTVVPHPVDPAVLARPVEVHPTSAGLAEIVWWRRAWVRWAALGVAGALFFVSLVLLAAWSFRRPPSRDANSAVAAVAPAPPVKVARPAPDRSRRELDVKKEIQLRVLSERIKLLERDLLTRHVAKQQPKPVTRRAHRRGGNDCDWVWPFDRSTSRGKRQ